MFHKITSFSLLLVFHNFVYIKDISVRLVSCKYLENATLILGKMSSIIFVIHSEIVFLKLGSRRIVNKQKQL